MTYTAGGVTFGLVPVMIGAGVCKTPEKTFDWLKLLATASGSYLQKPWSGNTGKVQYPDTLEEVRQLGFGINSHGMPNCGFDSAVEKFRGREFENSLVASVAGFKWQEYVEGIRMFTTLENVSAIELNFGCPNTGHGEIISFDHVSLSRLFKWQARQPVVKPIWVKFSPFSNPKELERRAVLVNKYKKFIKAVVTCNTFPNAYAGTEAIKTNLGNYGGLSGPALKHIALGQVCQFRKHLDPDIDVIGVGGNFYGDDIIDTLDAGAKAVQLTSVPAWQGEPSKFWDTLTSGPNCERFVETFQL
jgi:dihydroorotate dehydrogenase